MWKLNKISARNLCAFKTLDYTLNQGVTTLIFGNNMDNDSQGSNGAGKSAMLEAISIALTGDPLRKIKIEEIINDASDNASVTAELYNDMTNEKFIIERYLERGESQSVTCTICNELEGHTEDIIQASVADYNKYILDKIGLTKDDVFSNFILSKHRFKSFLSSSDKDKKEIINRFSNGIIVDASIEKLEEDIVPIDEKVRESEQKVANLNGSVSAIDEQIANAINETDEKKRSKTQRIEQLNTMIADKRKLIRTNESIITDCQSFLSSIDELNNKVVALENTDKSNEDIYKSLLSVAKEYDVNGLSDWNVKIEDNKKQLSSVNTQLDRLNENIKVSQTKLKTLKQEYDNLLNENKNYESESSSILKAFDDKIADINSKLDKAKNLLIEKRNKQEALNKDIAKLKNMIAGVIVCPKCSYEFVLEKNIDVDKTRSEIEHKTEESDKYSEACTKGTEHIQKLEQECDGVKQDKSFQEQENLRQTQKISAAQKKINDIYSELNALTQQQLSVTAKVNELTTKINLVRDSMFDEMYGYIDRVTEQSNNRIKTLKNDIDVADGAIKTFQKSIKELDNIDDGSIIDSLKSSKKKYNKALESALLAQDGIEAELNKYKEQVTRFTEFKTHLANMKIEALGNLTNEFLEQIGSDIRIKFSGFTLLKSGKIRDKISISLLRDGIDCGSFDKFSEGEKARVNLANILAMHKLTNVNCDDDKGIDLLILDEILEAADETGLASIFDALNNLKLTALVVSHGNIAENYPYRTVVNKLNGVSYIDDN